MTDRIWSSLSACMRGVAGFLVLALGAGIQPAAADPVVVGAQENPGYGQIVFAWPTPVTHRAFIADGLLSVTFDREIESDLAAAMGSFRSYVKDFRLLDGGRTAQFSLTKHYLYRSYVDGPRIVVELLGEGVAPAGVTSAPGNMTVAATPTRSDVAIPSMAPAKPGTEPVQRAVGARIGQHQGYGRVVFDWNVDVGYETELQDGTVIVTFNRSDGVDLTAFANDRLEQVLGARSRRDEGRTIVELDVASNSRLRHFRNGTKVVIDVLGAPDRAPSERIQVAAASAAAGARAEDPTPGDSETPAAPEVPELSPATTRASEAQGLSGDDVDLNIFFRQPVEGQARIEFDWSEPVAMAAFQRAGHLWVVFDAVVEGSVPPIPEELLETIFLAERVPSVQSTAIRIRHIEGLYPAVTETARGWGIDLLTAPVPPVQSIQLVRQRTADFGPVLVLPLSEASGILDVRDPEVGDVLQVVPVRLGGHAVSGDFSFTQFRLPPTQQGVVVERYDDRVRVVQFSNGIAVTGAGQEGLALTPLADGTVIGGGPGPAGAAGEGELTVDAAALNSMPSGAVLDLATWAAGPWETVREGVRELQHQVSMAPAGERTASRMALARYLFGNGLNYEAVGVLQVAGEMDPALLVDPQYLLMRGAVQYLIGQVDEATADLSQPALAKDLEAAAWRGAINADQRDWEAAHAEFQSAGNVFFGYDPVFRARLDISRGQAALQMSDFQALDGVLSMLQTAELPGEVGARAALLLADAFSAVEGYNDALEIYNSVQELGFPAPALEAKLSRIKIMLKLEQMTIEEAREALDADSFVWRGDGLEFRLMHQLGELSLQMSDYHAGLAKLRSAVALYPELSREAGIAQRMNDVFAELFLMGGADELSPVSAVALYYDFRELTPVGPEGDEMVRQLAQRLVGVDLLPQAAELLDYQVQFRLRGEEKSRVAASLAAVHVLNRDPETALGVLRNSSWQGEDPGLTAERNRIAARAYAQLGRVDEALAAISGDASIEALLLRIDVYWQDQQWDEVAWNLDTYLGTAWIEDRPLTDFERQHVLRIAVSMILDGDEGGAAVLRERYQQKMRGTSDADAFEVLTYQVDPSTVEFRRVAEQVARLDSLSAFRQSYLSRLGGDAAQAAVN